MKVSFTVEKECRGSRLLGDQSSSGVSNGSEGEETKGRKARALPERRLTSNKCGTRVLLFNYGILICDHYYEALIVPFEPTDLLFAHSVYFPTLLMSVASSGCLYC